MIDGSTTKKEKTFFCDMKNGWRDHSTLAKLKDHPNDAKCVPDGTVRFTYYYISLLTN